MATTDIERLAVLIEANTKQYTAAMNKLQADTNRALGNSTKAVKGLDTQLKTMSSNMVAFGKSFAGAFGIGLGLSTLTQIPRMIGNIVDEASRMVDAADRVGMTTDQLQELAHAASLADVDFSTLSGNMEQFTRRIADAGQGSGELLELLQANGVALRNQDGTLRDQAEMLEIVADLMANAASEQDKLNIAVMAFGRGGAEMVNVLAGGAQGLRDTANEARELGKVIDEELLRDAERIGDEWDKFTTSLTTSFKSFVLSVVTGAATARDELNSLMRLPGEVSVGSQTGAMFGSGADTAPRTVGVLAAAIGLDSFGGGKTTVIPGAGGGGAASPVPRMKPIIEETTVAVSELDTAMQNLADTAADFATTFIADLRAGKSAAEALGGVLASLADQMITSGIQMLANSIFGGFGAGGLVGGLFGRAGGGHVGAHQAYMVGERGPELFVPNTAGSIARGGAGGFGPTKIVLEFVEGDAFGGRVRQISGPQSQQISLSVVGANERRKARMEKTTA